MKRILFSLVLAVPFALASCGGGGGGGDSEPVAQESTAPAITRSVENFGVGGNLWKPKAEEKASNAGLLVVLLAPQHTDRFDGCEVTMIDGTTAPLDCNDRVDWSHTPFSCVANGGREHWRATFRCDEAALAQVVCRNATEEVTFEAPGAGLGAVCSRHG